MPVKGSIIPPMYSLFRQVRHTHKKNQHICSEEGHFIPSPFQSKEMHRQERDPCQKNEHQFPRARVPTWLATQDSHGGHTRTPSEHTAGHTSGVFLS